MSEPLSAWEARAVELGVPQVDLDERLLDRQLLADVPIELMVRHGFVPLRRDDDGALVIAMADPSDVAAVDALEGLLDTDVRIEAAAPDAVERAHRRAGAGERILESVHDQFEPTVASGDENDEGLTLASLATDAGHPIVRLVDTTVLNALERRASDIHIETRDDSVWIKYRVDGVLYRAMEPIELRHHDAVISRIKVMSDLDIAEKRVPQDGRISVRIANRPVDVRVSTIPSGSGERVVLRLLDKQAGRLALEQIGMDAATTAEIDRIIHLPHGIFLVTGPTGSGKTTTLYAALTRINDRSRNLMTVEDPIEYYIDGIAQTQVNTRVDMTFARGLRAILRQDPDVVMVGEIRDIETASIAIQASLTGHLVLSTLHTNTAVGALARLRDMGTEPFLLASSLVGVLAQRLVRRLCEHCRQPVAPDQRLADSLDLSLAELEQHQTYTAVGCSECLQMGYRGRRAIYELVTVDESLRRLIHDNASEPVIEQHVRARCPSLFAQGRAQVLAGATSAEELVRVTASG